MGPSRLVTAPKLLPWGLLIVLASACGDDTLRRIPGPADGGLVPPLPDPAVYDGGPTPPPPPPPNVDLGSPPEPSQDAGFIDQGTPDQGAPDAGQPIDMGEPINPPECYTEPFDPTISISDLQAQYNGSNALSVLIEALRRRYPAGADLLIEEQDDPYTGSFIDRSSFGTVMDSAGTEVHEATHGWDYSHALFYQYFGYWLRDDLKHQLTFNVDGFPRSQIYGDIADGSTDLYKNLYLTGEQGTRGLLELLDETNCYINGLGATAAIADYIPFGISGRDGAVAFLYYVQLYLRRARTQSPQLYAQMQADTALKEHIQTQWLRAHFFLMFADMSPHIGIRDGEIRANLYAPQNIAEISMLIGRCVDQTNCLCD